MKSIRNRLFLLSIGAVSLCIILTGAVSIVLLNIRYVQHLKNNLLDQSVYIAKIIERVPKGGVQGEVTDISRHFGRRLRITVIGSDGSVMADSESSPGEMTNHLGRPEIREAAQKGTGFARRRSATLGKDYFYVARKCEADNGSAFYVRVASPVEFVNSTIRHIEYIALMALVSVLVMSAVMMRFVADGFAAPVKRIMEVSEKIAGGELSARSGLRGNDELGRLGAAIDRMAGEIQNDIQELEQKRAETEKILAGLRDGLIVIGNDGGILLINEAAHNVFNLEKRDYTRTQFINVIHQKKINDMVAKTLAESIYCESEVELNPIAGNVIDVRVFPLRGGQREKEGAIVVVRDVTKLKRLEQIRTEFIENASHEMRTPVALIRGFVETLLGGAMDVETDRVRFLKLLDKESVRLSNLMEDILALAGAERNREDVTQYGTEIVHAIRSSIDKYLEMAAGRGLVLETDFDDAAAVVNIPEQEFISIFANLVENAVKFTERGGVTISVKADERVVRLSVRDTGIGIRPDDLQKVFERFYRTDKSRSRAMGGTGLGLSIVKHLVEKWGGTVAVNSRVGEGSIFTVEFPAVRS